MKSSLAIFAVAAFSLVLMLGCKKNASDCTDTATRGPLFTPARSLITSRCSGSNCHLSGRSAGGYNFDADCSIVDSYNSIQSVCNSGRMPVSPQSSFTTAEKAIINDWAAGGHSLVN